MNKPITLCDRCEKAAVCLLNFDGIPCRKNRTVEPTNADRIRSMSDEELADLLTAVAKKSAEMLCKSLKTVEVDLSKCDFEILTKTHLSWLKSRVEEDNG